jgi:hypothetical protein
MGDFHLMGMIARRRIGMVFSLAGLAVGSVGCIGAGEGQSEDDVVTVRAPLTGTAITTTRTSSSCH